MEKGLQGRGGRKKGKKMMLRRRRKFLEKEGKGVNKGSAWRG